MKDENYWIRWLKEHDDLGMAQEVADLSMELSSAMENGWSDDRIVKAGRREAELVHQLLEYYDVEGLADVLMDYVVTPAGGRAISVEDLMSLNTIHLATRPDGTILNPAWN